MDTRSYTTKVSFENDNKSWLIIDAENQTLGRFASQVANIVRGKTKTNYTPHADCGDYVIIINAEKIRLTGKKMDDKVYTRYTGYPGGATVESFKALMKTKPEKVLTHAIKGMIPHNRLGAQVIKKLKVYRGTEHPHAAQKPEALKF